MFETSLSKLLTQQGKSASEADLLYVAKDNEIAHTAINEICKTLIQRLSEVEKYVTTELSHPAKVQYRPPGKEEYLTLKENLDLIYERLNNLEEK